MRSLLAALSLCLLLSSYASAHDSWISKGGHRSVTGELCCGEGDCGILVAGRPVAVTGGWQINATFRVTLPNGQSFDLPVNEIVPYAETQPSPDGAFWRCHRPDRTRRCFFAPPPNT